MTNAQIFLAVAGILVPASVLIAGSIWRLASKIGELTATVANDRESCLRRHKNLDDDRTGRGSWIQIVENKIDAHVSNHARGLLK